MGSLEARENVYSICDEYEAEFEVSPGSSAQPLTLGGLVGLIDNAGLHESLGIDFHPNEFRMAGCKPERRAQALDFTTVSSIFYPQLKAHYQQLVAWWYSTQSRVTTGC